MNNAAIKALRDMASNIITITKTADGYEVRKAGRLVGITKTHAGAQELASHG
jgi:hypothetical protein